MNLLRTYLYSYCLGQGSPVFRGAACTWHKRAPSSVPPDNEISLIAQANGELLLYWQGSSIQACQMTQPLVRSLLFPIVTPMPLRVIVLGSSSEAAILQKTIRLLLWLSQGLLGRGKIAPVMDGQLNFFCTAMAVDFFLSVFVTSSFSYSSSIDHRPFFLLFRGEQKRDVQLSRSVRPVLSASRLNIL